MWYTLSAMSKKLPLTIRTELVRQWFKTCDPKATQVRDHLKRAANLIWQRQTFAEQDLVSTIDHNGIGYNGRDADFASRIINWRGTLSVKMAFAARKMLQKYAKQLADIALRKEAING